MIHEALCFIYAFISMLYRHFSFSMYLILLSIPIASYRMIEIHVLARLKRDLRKENPRPYSGVIAIQG